MRTRRSTWARRRQKRILFFRLSAFLLAIGLLFLALDRQLAPYIQGYSTNLAKTLTMRAMDAAVERVLSNSEVAYHNMVHIARNSDGDIEALETDAVAVNRLKATLTETILDEMAKDTYRKVGIPMGNLSGIHLLFGRGPKLPYRISVNSASVTNIRSTFDSAGINQTRHQLLVTIEMSVFAYLPGRGITTDVTSEYLMAETILVGEVPPALLYGNMIAP